MLNTLIRHISRIWRTTVDLMTPMGRGNLELLLTLKTI